MKLQETAGGKGNGYEEFKFEANSRNKRVNVDDDIQTGPSSK